MKPQNFIILILTYIFLCACDSKMNQDKIINKYTDSNSRFMEVQGNKVHFKDEGNGEILVLIHGTASSLHTWDQWSNRLSKHFRIIRMDLPGFGLTGPDKLDRYEVPDDVAFLNIFLTKLNVSQAHFIGSSLGGRIAWEYSLEHPQQVKTLTLINALGYPQDSWPPGIQLAMLPIMENLMPLVSSRLVFSQSLHDVYHDRNIITDKLIDRYFELSLFPGNAEAFPKRVKAKLDDQGEKIKAIKCPTLILWGKEDKYFPVKNAKKFAHDIQGATLKLYENVGHLPMEENPDQSSQDFIEFIKTSI